jgi:phenylalanine-4-hydroxylase
LSEAHESGFSKPPAFGADELVKLDKDHPGFRDAAYRARRNLIAQAAMDYRGGEVPRVEYVEAEHSVWRSVWEHLAPLHELWAPRGYLVLNHRLGLDRARIPQLADVNARLKAVTGFEMKPVAGLIAPRTFLKHLGEGTFLATQYVRHHTTPLYTPEPDVIHELIGHAASFTHPMIAAMNRSFGLAAATANDAEVVRLERAYWWTMEFGGLMEDGVVKAFGSGLLSSFGEIGRFATNAKLLPFDIAAMAATPYDPTDYQPQVFVAPSWEALYYDLSTWLDDGVWRDPA